MYFANHLGIIRSSSYNITDISKVGIKNSPKENHSKKPSMLGFKKTDIYQQTKKKK